jgi:hypothetical protein
MTCSASRCPAVVVVAPMVWTSTASCGVVDRAEPLVGLPGELNLAVRVADG